MLFGIIKGIKVDSLGIEADKRIEEVRLTESANQCAGTFSGGMKRRLSVAVSLAGNPNVVSPASILFTMPHLQCTPTVIIANQAQHQSSNLRPSKVVILILQKQP